MPVGLLKKILPLAWLIALAPLTARADLEQAEKLFQSGDAAKALQAYKTELAAHPDRTALPPAFYFNYGTVAAKAGLPGEGYVALTRAAFALPFDSDTRYNLKLTEAQLPAAVLSVQPSQWMQWWPRSVRTLPWKLWLLLALIASGGAFALRRVADRTLAVTVAVLAAGLYVWGALAWNQARVPVFGVVAITKVKSGPGSTFSDILQLEPGSLVNEETVRSGWLKIRFTKAADAEETVGWVEPGSVLQILSIYLVCRPQNKQQRPGRRLLIEAAHDSAGLGIGVRAGKGEDFVPVDLAHFRELVTGERQYRGAVVPAHHCVAAHAVVALNQAANQPPDHLRLARGERMHFAEHHFAHLHQPRALVTKHIAGKRRQRKQKCGEERHPRELSWASTQRQPAS